MAGLSQVRKAASVYFTEPVVRVLSRTPITPNSLTWFGFVLSVGAAALVATGQFVIAGGIVLFGGLFDMLDGALARRTNRVTLFGSVLDSTLDRLSEGALLIGALVFFLDKGSDVGVLLVGVVLMTSMLVSYIRARAEVIGIDCLVGIFTRPERVIVLALGLFINQLEIAMWIIAGFSSITICQRLFYVWRQTKNKKAEGE